MYLILGIVLLIVIVFYYNITKNNNYWAKRGLPHEKPEFFFGNLRDVILGAKHFGLGYSDLYKKFKHLPYFGYFKLQEPGIVINDPELIKNVIVKDFSSFADNDFYVDPEVDRVWSANVFGQTGEKWKKTRSIWTYGMTSSKIKAMYEEINKKCDLMINYIDKHIKNHGNKPLEVRILAQKFFTDVIVSCMLGLKVNSFEEKEKNIYFNIASSMFISDFWQRFSTLTFLIAPWLGQFFKMRFVRKETEDQLIGLARQILQDRAKNGYQKQNPFDSMVMHTPNQEGVSELEVAGFLFGFLLDGTETSSGVSGHALYSLAKYPHIQDRLRKELDDLAATRDGKLTYEDIHQMEYLDNVISETMRIYPPSMAIQRLCTKPYTLPPYKSGASSIEVPKDMPIIVPTYGLHMNPEFFPDPEKFDPDRFNDENKNSIIKYTYMPFGEGPRICMGVRLAMNQVKIGLASTIRNFEVRLAPEMIGKTLGIDPNIFVMRNPGGLMLTFHPRKK